MIGADEHTPRSRGRRAAAIVRDQRPHARITPHHIVRPDAPIEAAVHGVAQVRRLRGADGDAVDVLRVVVDVRRADQRERALVRQREHDAAVRLLQQERLVAVEQARHDDVAALHEPQGACRAGPRRLQAAARPRPGRVHNVSGADDGRLTGDLVMNFGSYDCAMAVSHKLRDLDVISGDASISTSLS